MAKSEICMCKKPSSLAYRSYTSYTWLSNKNIEYLNTSFQKHIGVNKKIQGVLLRQYYLLPYHQYQVIQVISLVYQEFFLTRSIQVLYFRPLTNADNNRTSIWDWYTLCSDATSRALRISPSELSNSPKSFLFYYNSLPLYFKSIRN